MAKSTTRDPEAAVEEAFQSLPDLPIPDPSPKTVEEVTRRAVAAFTEGKAQEGKSVH